MQKPKILIISMAYFPRFVGGAEVALKELTDRLGDEFEFHMVTLRYDSTLPRVSMEGNVLVHRIGFSTKNPSLADLRKLPLHLNKYLFQPLAFLKGWSLHRTHRYAAVWAMMAHSAGIPGSLLTIADPRLPMLLSLQEGDTPEHIARKARPSLFLFGMAFRRARIIQPLSLFLAEWAKSRGGRDVRVVPNGVELARFGKPLAPSRRSELRTRMKAKEDEHLLMTVSRLVPKNGIDLVIEALTLLPPRVKFAVLGDGPERAYLTELAAMRGVSDRVTFLGEIQNADIHQYLSAADSFVRASRSEGQGISFIEAMAAGLPTIGTNVGGIPDFLKDGETGYLIEPESPEAVASAVRRVIEQPIEANAIAEGGKRLVNEQYGWDLIAKHMGAILKELL
jgi:glycosyltransferase involved in cell wall biosynthesis